VKSANVRRDVFADGAVPARRTGNEHAALIRQADGGAIDLELAVVARASHFFARESDDALLPRHQLLLVEGITQRQHGDEMRVLGELALRLSPDALRR